MLFIQLHIIKSLYLCHLDRLAEIKSLIIHYKHILLGFIVLKIYSLLLLLLLLSDLLFSKFILHYQHHYHYYYHYHYCYYYQILILIPYQYNSQFLYFILHIYILLKIFEGDIFHMHRVQNLELLLINIYVVFFLLVLFQTLFYHKNLQLYCFHVFIFVFMYLPSLPDVIFQFFSIVYCNFEKAFYL